MNSEHARNAIFTEMEAAGWVAQQDDGFIGLVGPLWRQQSDREERYAFWAEPKHRNRRGVVQGGMLTTLADRAMGATARKNDPAIAQATVQLSINFVAPAELAALVEISCQRDRATRSLVFVSGRMTQGDRLIATCTGVWKRLGA